VTLVCSAGDISKKSRGGLTMGFLLWGQELFDKIRNSVDFVGPLLLRLYLVPGVFFRRR
jgi:hypothetical protein